MIETINKMNHLAAILQETGQEPGTLLAEKIRARRRSADPQDQQGADLDGDADRRDDDNHLGDFIEDLRRCRHPMPRSMRACAMSAGHPLIDAARGEVLRMRFGSK
jgi:hypothetical protein